MEILAAEAERTALPLLHVVYEVIYTGVILVRCWLDSFPDYSTSKNTKIK